MELIKQEKFNRKIKEEFNYNFEIEKESLYLIEVIASCKSWWQNLIKFTSFFKDDDLTVKIDGISFPKLDGRQGLFDSEVAWNGNNLKGLKKTNTFLLYLIKGQHTIQFLADQKPYLETLKIYSVRHLASNISYLPTDNNPAEDGNRRQWFVIILANLPLKNLSITAKAEKRKRDDDDLKLIIDGQIQKNAEPKSHKYWYWCGKTLNGKEKEFSKETNLNKGLHYIELWADRMPQLEKFEIGLGKIDFKIKARVVWQYTVLRKEPNQASKSIEKINKNGQVYILEKAVKGDRPTNEESESLFSDRWHKAEYQTKTGYIYSEALEIEGEDKETITNLILKKSEELKEDGCLMLAIAERESKLFPYAVSGAGAQGLFQLKEIAVSHVNEKFGREFTDRFNIDQNIEAAILYFQIIKAKYKNKDSFWEKCLAAWNRGMDRIDANEVFVMGEQPIATQQFIRDVSRFWNNYKKILKNSGKILLFLSLLLGFAAFIILIYSQFFFKEKEPFSIPNDFKGYAVLAEGQIDVDKDGQNEKIVIVSNIPTEFTFGVTRVLLIKKDGSFVEISKDGAELQWWKIDDFNKNGNIDIAILYGYRGSAGFGQFYLHEWSSDGFVSLFAKEDIANEVVFEDLDNDDLKEIIYSFQPLKWSKTQQEIYKWDEKSSAYIKIN